MLLAGRSPAAATRVGGPIAPGTGLGIAQLIARSERDFDFVEFIPLGIGALTVRNSQQGAQAILKGDWLRFIHIVIISLSPGWLDGFYLLCGISAAASFGAR
jgi:hypothetical protein